MIRRQMGLAAFFFIIAFGSENAAQAMSDDEMVKELETFVAKVGEKEVFSGTVILAKGGKVLFEKAIGLASRGWNMPNKIDTKFNLGSMNKMFTAVAIAQLAEKGK